MERRVAREFVALDGCTHYDDAEQRCAIRAASPKEQEAYENQKTEQRHFLNVADFEKLTGRRKGTASIHQNNCLYSAAAQT